MRQQVDGGFDVIEVGGFDDRVHAAQGQRYQSTGHAGAGAENFIGIRASEARTGFVLNGDFFGLGDVDQAFDHRRMIGASVRQGGAPAESDVAELVGVDAGSVRGVGDIEACADIGHQAMCGHHRAIAADFLLHSIEANDGKVGTLFLSGEAFEHLRDDETADAVVERATDETFVRELDGSIGIDCDMADAESECCDFLGAGGTDIDPQLMDGGHFFRASGIAAQVDGGIANDAHDLPLIAEKTQASAPRGGDIAAADAVEPKKALCVDVLDDEANFIGMSSKHHRAIGFPAADRPRGAVAIALYFVGIQTGIFRPNALPRHFKAGGARRMKEF